MLTFLLFGGVLSFSIPFLLMFGLSILESIKEMQQDSLDVEEYQRQRYFSELKNKRK